MKPTSALIGIEERPVFSKKKKLPEFSSVEELGNIMKKIYNGDHYVSDDQQDIIDSLKNLGVYPPDAGQAV